MHPIAFLLRLLLSVSLIANGAGYAQASARMQSEHAVRASVAHADEAPANDQHSAPCHRHGAAMASMSHATHETVASDGSRHGLSSAECGNKASDDCCKGKTCDCACASACCTTDVASATNAATRFRMVVPVSTPAHLQPRLPNLIRPPIG